MYNVYINQVWKVNRGGMAFCCPEPGYLLLLTGGSTDPGSGPEARVPSEHSSLFFFRSGVQS